MIPGFSHRHDAILVCSLTMASLWAGGPTKAVGSSLESKDASQPQDQRSGETLDSVALSSYLLENAQISIALDRESAGIVLIKNKLTGESFRVNDSVFRIEAGTGAFPGTLGTLTPTSCAHETTAAGKAKASYVFSKGPLKVTVSYRLAPEDSFAVKRIRVDYAGAGKFNINRFDMFDWDLQPKPVKAIPYYGFQRPSVLTKETPGEDVPPSDTSTAFFFRSPEGGVFTALSCDFALMKEEAASARYRSSYWPGRILAAGQPFESELGIVGVYRRKGLFHAPYRPKAELREFHSPDVDTRLDYGEIEGICAAVCKFIKPGVYLTLVNGWGMGLPRLIESQEDADAFKRAVDTLAKMPALEGLHFVHGWCGLAREFREKGLAMKVKPNPCADQVFRYAGEKGMKLSPFIGISNNYPLMDEEGGGLIASPELLSSDAQGERRAGNIAISDQYADFAYKTISTLCEKYPWIGGQTYDFLRLMPDYDTNHGYLPGRASLYPQYANLRDLDRRLRERFPDLMLRGQVGWMWLGPWLAENMSLCHNSNDHGCANLRNFLDFHIDHQFANNVRASNWFTNNCKMHPRHKMNSNSIHNGSQFRAWDYGAFQYAVLSQMATSQVFGMLHDLPDEQNGEVWRKEDVEFFSKWIGWHKAHGDYYLRETELFGEPRPTGVDGYAYGNGQDSIVFLCNPAYRTHWVEVPIDSRIHLPEGRAYTVKELYPEERYRAGLSDGVFGYGSSFVTAVPPQTVMVFEVKPDDPDQALLLGIAGKLQSSSEGFAITGATGPSGQDRLVAIRLPAKRRGADKVSLGGETLPTARSGGLMLAALRFGGQAIDPEVHDWKAVREGDRLRIQARFNAPESARAVLKSQALPIAAKYDTAKYRNEAAWLGWGRFIIYIAAVPPETKPEELRGEKVKAAEAYFTPKARLNGEPIEVHSNYLGARSKRWTGLFIDATDQVAYGKVNDLQLDLRTTSEGRFFGIYLPNLTPQTSCGATALPAPERLAIGKIPEAADPYIPTPVVLENGDRQTAFLRLSVTALKDCSMHPSEVLARDGDISAPIVLGADSRWAIGGAPAMEGRVALSDKPRQFLLRVEGTPKTELCFGVGKGNCSITLGNILDAWKRNGDRFDPYATTLVWPAKEAEIRIELSAPQRPKQAAREDL